MSNVAEDTRQKLIDAAREQFYKKGINETTLEKITRQAFVQPSAVSYYFGGKKGLIETVIDGFYTRLAEKAMAISDDEKIRPVIWIYLLWSNIACDSNIARGMMEFLTMDISDSDSDPSRSFSQFIQNIKECFGLKEDDPRPSGEPDYHFILNNHMLYGMMKYALKHLEPTRNTAVLLARTDTRIKGIIAGVRDLDEIIEKCREAEAILAGYSLKDLSVEF